MAVQDIPSFRHQGHFEVGGSSIGLGRSLQESHAVFKDRIYNRSLHFSLPAAAFAALVFQPGDTLTLPDSGYKASRTE
jgi:hypothetical protein